VQFRRPIPSTFIPPDLRKQLPRSNSEGPKLTQNRPGRRTRARLPGVAAPALQRQSARAETEAPAPTARQRHECVGKRMLSDDELTSE
jgi:hypothetical protein